MLLECFGRPALAVKRAGLDLADMVEQRLQGDRAGDRCARRGRSSVKIAGQPPQRVDIAASADGIHVFQQLANFGDFGRRRVLRGKPRRHALKRLAHVKEFGQIPFAQRAYDQAGARIGRRAPRPRACAKPHAPACGSRATHSPAHRCAAVRPARGRRARCRAVAPDKPHQRSSRSSPSSSRSARNRIIDVHDLDIAEPPPIGSREQQQHDIGNDGQRRHRPG